MIIFPELIADNKLQHNHFNVSDLTLLTTEKVNWLSWKSLIGIPLFWTLSRISTSVKFRNSLAVNTSSDTMQICC